MTRFHREFVLESLVIIQFSSVKIVSFPPAQTGQPKVDVG